MPSFARPLPQSPRSEVLEWPLPAPHSHLVLTGRSRAAWHTSFVVPQLGLLLDAGLCVNRLRPPHVLLTHGHSDHVLLAPAFVRRAAEDAGGDEDRRPQRHPPDFYCPAEMARALDDFILATTMLNLGGLVGAQDAASQGFPPVDSDAEDDDTVEARAGRTPSERAFLQTHTTRGLAPGDVVTLRRRPRDPVVTVTAFACDHSVPCLGYVVAQTTHRLRDEYADRPGADLGRLRRAGVEITRPHSTPLFAFLGDSTAATLAAAPRWLRDGIPVVVTECSFLYPEHKPQADRTKHTVWRDLEPVVRRWPRTTFVLTHFSLRYSEADVAAFFRAMADPPPNIVVWADPEA